MTHVVLAGNPNCGKTTLFNALTGDNQRVGNWPGVTVEKKAGSYSYHQQTVTVTDLPGIYSLTMAEQGISQDEQIAASAMVSVPFDVIINVIDACHLERHLYLSSQLLELGKPVVIALNMTDIAAQRGIHIDLDALSQQLGCPVVPLQAHKGVGIETLKQVASQARRQAKPLALSLPATMLDYVEQCRQQLMANGLNPELAAYYVWRRIEGDTGLAERLSDCALPEMADEHEEFDIILADARGCGRMVWPKNSLKKQQKEHHKYFIFTNVHREKNHEV